MERIFGLETEYATISNNPDSHVGFIFRALRRGDLVLPASLWGGVANEFKSDASREYVDNGASAELSLAEDTDFGKYPYRIYAAHVSLGRRYVAESTEPEYYSDNNKFKVSLYANVEDSAGNSWASHANYLASRKLEEKFYIAALAVHNLSRIVWSGAGSVVWDRKAGFSYHLSERAKFIKDVIGFDTISRRALVNLRDEPLADEKRFRRIHDVSGETVFSPNVNTLRFAATSIILRACELGVNFFDLMPEFPVAALHSISSDPTLRRLVVLKNGRKLSALDLQQELAVRSLEHTLRAGYITQQEIKWGKYWLDLIDDLKAGHLDRRSNELDWILKQKLIEKELERNSKDQRVTKNRFYIAQAKALHYHKLAPEEGGGMRALRAGIFPNSPSDEVFEKGVELPQTRARLRVQAIRELIDLGLFNGADWCMVSAKDNLSPAKALLLNDPYETDPARLKDWIKSLRGKPGSRLSRVTRSLRYKKESVA